MLFKKKFTKKFSYKKWALVFTFFGLSITWFIVLFNYIVDPYQIYRKTSLYTFQETNQRYMNVGFAKNYPYQTLFLGSSMIENFYLDDIKQYKEFPKPIKLAFEGGRTYEISALLNVALTNNPNLKNVVIGLDLVAFNGEAMHNYKISMPSYLYNNSIIDDTPYLLNFTIFKKSLKTLQHPYNAKKVEEKLNSLYNWEKKYTTAFTLQNVYNSYNFHLKNALKAKKEQPNKYKNDNSSKTLKDNFKNTLLKQIKAHPKINFYLFYTPNSILQYKLLEKSGTLKNYIELKRYIFESTKDLQNVKIYDFQVAKNIVTNLHNYKDTGHYSAKINSWILQQMSQGNYLLTNKNINTYLKQFYLQTVEYKMLPLQKNKK